MKKINLNNFASDLCAEELKGKQVNIADMKEIVGAMGRVFRKYGILKSLLTFISVYQRAGK